MSLASATLQPRRTYNRHDPADLRSRILAAATAEFAENGFGGARVDAIARRSGANKRMIYLHFADKQALYEAVRKRLRARLRVADLAIPPQLDPVAAVRATVTALARFFAANLELVLLHRDGLPPVDEWPPGVRDLGEQVRRGIGSGAFRPDADPAVLLHSIAALATLPAATQPDIAEFVLGYLRR